MSSRKGLPLAILARTSTPPSLNDTAASLERSFGSGSKVEGTENSLFQ